MWSRGEETRGFADFPADKVDRVKTIYRAILQSPIAEHTCAQVIDGLPIASCYDPTISFRDDLASRQEPSEAARWRYREFISSIELEHFVADRVRFKLRVCLATILTEVNLN